MRWMLRPTLADDGHDLLIRKDHLCCAELVTGVISSVIILFALTLVGLILHDDREPLRSKVVDSVVMGLLLALVGAALFESRHVLSLGVWQINAAGVEFRPRSGITQRLAWAEVEHIRWSGSRVQLAGKPGRITLQRGLMLAADWQCIRNRLEATLTSRFDLVDQHQPRRIGPKTRLNWLRVLDLTVMTVAPFLASLWLVLQDPIRWAAWVTLGWFFTSLIPTIGFVIYSYVTSNQQRWWTPRCDSAKKSLPDSETAH